MEFDRMARIPPGHRPEWPEMLFGSKSVRGLLPLLEQLPPLSDHPNRVLQTRDVFVAHLLAFFNPTLRSLRTLEDFSRTRQARRYLAVDRLPKSTLADFHRLVDPAVLRAGRGPPAPGDRPAGPEGPGRPARRRSGQVLAVDGTFLALAADVAWAVRHAHLAGRPAASVRVDVHLDVASGLPRVVNVHGAGTSEPASAAALDRPGGRPRLRPRLSSTSRLIRRHLERPGRPCRRRS